MQAYWSKTRCIKIRNTQLWSVYLLVYIDGWQEWLGEGGGEERDSAYEDTVKRFMWFVLILCIMCYVFIECLISVALRVYSLFMTNSFAKLGIRTSRWQHKECNDEPSERFFLCLIGKSRANLFPSHTSSCAMGNMLTNSVVDKYLR